MKIVYSEHAKMKMKERKIQAELVEKVVVNPEITFYDVLNRTIVAISKVLIQTFETNLVVIYTKQKEV